MEEGRTNGHADGHVEEVLRHSRALKDDAGALVGEIKHGFDDLSRRLDLKGRMERNPWGMVAAAVGVGYLLGGGLFTRSTARLLHLGSRALLVPILRSQVEAFATGVAASATAAPGFGGSEDGQGGM
ncbi:MAG TPA: hypothetical protein VGK67_37840 [Myxococcales bacterium]|jgi:hypothetical protein